MITKKKSDVVAIDGTWYKSGSTRNGVAYFTGGQTAVLHRAVNCPPIFTRIVSQIDVFHHTSIGTYIIDQLNGQRRSPKWCGVCNKGGEL